MDWRKACQRQSQGQEEVDFHLQLFPRVRRYMSYQSAAGRAELMQRAVELLRGG